MDEVKVISSKGNSAILIDPLTNPFIIAVAVAIAIIPPQPLYAAQSLPEISSVVAGQVQISKNGQSMQVDTQTARTVINWKDFSIGADNKVHFKQPDGSSVTLNRVTGKDPSNIFGVLTSNGQLVLLNPNGIWFGPNSKISTQSLVAGAGMITDEQLKKFEQSGKLDISLSGMISNAGKITAADNGMVTLLGAQVANSGVIQARQGKAMLATGPAATLDFHGDGLINIAITQTSDSNAQVNSGLTGGVHNTGHIDVGSGVITMSAQRAAGHLDSVINLGGTVVADSVSEQGGTIVLGHVEKTLVSGTVSAKGTQGGEIHLLGENVTLAPTARIDASGSVDKGGRILVGGDYQGKGSVPRAKTVSVNKGASLKAQGKTDGGTIVAWSENQTHFAGSASVKGGERGGVIETSGRQLNVTKDAEIDLSGTVASGKWLLDPEIVTVSDDTSASNDIPNASDTGNWTVSNLAVARALEQQGVVEITASARININAPIVVKKVFEANGTGATLSLIASGNPTQGKSYAGKDLHEESGSVYINAPIILQGGNLFIAATGDVVLKDNAPGQTGESAWNKRAIIDLGSGIAWIKTSNSGSIFQESNTALKASQVALQGASVRMDSELNYAEKLAGRATNGIFTYSQTNATGNTAYGPNISINSPLADNPESLADISSEQLKLVGEKLVSADEYNDSGITLSSNEAFDYLVFSAGNYKVIDKDGNVITLPEAEFIKFLDYSDYLVTGITFLDSNKQKWTIKANANNPELSDVYLNDVFTNSLPVGFAFQANNGTYTAIEIDYNGKVNGWGVKPYQGQKINGALFDEEIQYHPESNRSQQLIINLGTKTNEVQANLGFLMDDAPWIAKENNPNSYRNLYEQAKIYMLSSTKNAADSIQVTTYQAKVNANSEDATRIYGDSNPVIIESRINNDAMNKIIEVDNFIAQQLNDENRNTFTVNYSRPAPNTNVGQYSVEKTISGGTDVDKRYAVELNTSTMTITPASLVVVADNHIKQVGETDPTFTFTIDERQWKFAQDKQGVTLGREAGENIGSYSIDHASHTISANYLVTVINGELKILGPTSDPTPPVEPPVDNKPIDNKPIDNKPVDVKPIDNLPVTDDPVIDNPIVPPVDNPPTPTNPGVIDMRSTGISLTGGANGERCTTIESPSSIMASDTASPAIVRAWSVQLICKPRSYGEPEEQLPAREEVIGYITNAIEEGKFRIPDWNRTLIPTVRDLEKNREGN